MWDDISTELELALALALGKRFCCWALDMAWISLVKPYSCLFKENLNLFSNLSTSSCIKMRDSDSESALPLWAFKKSLISELFVSVILSFASVSYFFYRFLDFYACFEKLACKRWRFEFISMEFDESSEKLQEYLKITLMFTKSASRNDRDLEFLRCQVTDGNMQFLSTASCHWLISYCANQLIRV